MRRPAAALVSLVLALAAAPAAPQAQSSFADLCNIQTTERIVAVGDVHGAYDRLTAILRAAALVDARDRWSGGRAVLVQTGDVLDRGADSRRILDLLRRLEREAQRAGGRVLPLIGNHEFMRLIGDWRYVSAGEYAAFRSGDAQELRERFYELVRDSAVARARAEQREHDEAAFRKQFLEEIPLGWVEMRQSFGPNGDYGAWLRGRVAAVKINGVLFLHGGVTPETAPLGYTGLNAAVARDARTPNLTLEEGVKLFSSSEGGPLWDRTLADREEEAYAPAVTSILEALGARAVIVGHTVAPGFRITPRFAGRVIQIDTGMLGGEHYPGGVPSALEIRGNAMTAIYLDGREPVGSR